MKKLKQRKTIKYLFNLNVFKFITHFFRHNIFTFLRYLNDTFKEKTFSFWVGKYDSHICISLREVLRAKTECVHQLRWTSKNDKFNKKGKKT